MSISLDLEDDLGSWKQFQKLIKKTSFKLKADNGHIDFVNPTADLRDY